MVPREDLEAATKVRDGALYELLKQRTILTRKNLENRLEVAKLSILASKLETAERKTLAIVVTDGRIVAPLSISTLPEPERALLARVLRRCGIPCSFSKGAVVPTDSLEVQELSMEVGGKRIWISAERASLMRENLKKIPAISTKIQLKNAERQIRTFPPEEEKEFETLQHSYLTLLKEQDEIVKEYSDEEMLSAKKIESTEGVAAGLGADVNVVVDTGAASNSSGPASPVTNDVVVPSPVVSVVVVPAVSTPSVGADNQVVVEPTPSVESTSIESTSSENTSSESGILDPALIANLSAAVEQTPETKPAAKSVSPDDEPITFDDVDGQEEEEISTDEEITQEEREALSKRD